MSRAAPAVAARPTPAEANGWGAGVGFADQRRLDEHYAKHGAEFGRITKQDYLHQAQLLRDARVGGPILEAVRRDGVITRFDRRPAPSSPSIPTASSAPSSSPTTASAIGVARRSAANEATASARPARRRRPARPDRPVGGVRRRPRSQGLQLRSRQLAERCRRARADPRGPADVQPRGAGRARAEA